MQIIQELIKDKESFEDWKAYLDDVSTNRRLKPTHHHKGIETWSWPAIVLCIMDMHGASGTILFDYSAISKHQILQLLGLSTEDIKLKFDALDPSSMVIPDISEAREV